MEILSENKRAMKIDPGREREREITVEWSGVSRTQKEGHRRYGAGLGVVLFDFFGVMLVSEYVQKASKS